MAGRDYILKINVIQRFRPGSFQFMNDLHKPVDSLGQLDRM